MKKVLIIGGGAAGMLASIFAAKNGHEVHVYEKNGKLGKKLFITGKGRCNITNAADMDEVFSSVVTNPKFLYSSLYGFTNQNVIDFFESIGVTTKVERGERVFPASDRSGDVIQALTKEMKREGVNIHLSAPIKRILTEQGQFSGIETEDGKKVGGDACIITTGGASYQTTGSTGDGYRFAKELGHQVTEIYPSLVPLEIKEEFVKRLQGLSLRNVRVSVWDGKKTLYQEFGEMLFTHYGVSGPLILSASSFIGSRLKK
ncbi:MAG: aminoacetone oxidase family FAD-binding enzyme, partial [Lachnospiraceae bacterium]